MKTYKVTVRETTITTYLIDAESEEAASLDVWEAEKEDLPQPIKTECLSYDIYEVTQLKEPDWIKQVRTKEESNAGL